MVDRDEVVNPLLHLRLRLPVAEEAAGQELLTRRSSCSQLVSPDFNQIEERTSRRVIFADANPAIVLEHDVEALLQVFVEVALELGDGIDKVVWILHISHDLIPSLGSKRSRPRPGDGWRCACG